MLRHAERGGVALRPEHREQRRRADGVPSVLTEAASTTQMTAAAAKQTVLRVSLFMVVSLGRTAVRM